MTQLFIALVVGMLSAAPPDDVVSVSARINAEHRDVGKEMRLFVTVDLKEGWSGSDAGVPNFILQVDAPASVEMIGERLDEKSLAKNGFLRPPEEKMAEGRETSFEFKLTKSPDSADAFAINVLGYVSDPKQTDAWFIRRRIKLSLAKDAKTEVVKTDTSKWGVGDELELGEKAVTFKLPKADGTIVDLDQYLGKKNIIITTYRAFW